VSELFKTQTHIAHHYSIMCHTQNAKQQDSLTLESSIITILTL